jgi:hypothetical protein
MKSKQLATTRNPSNNQTQINLKSLIQDNCVKFKQNNKNNNAFMANDKFSIEILDGEKMPSHIKISEQNIDKNNNTYNQNSLEFDNFDDINSIVKRLSYGKIDVKKDNIFSQDNFVYKNFEEKFNTEFDLAMNKFKSGSKNTNKSISTQDNSSKKGISPFNNKNGQESKYLLSI